MFGRSAARTAADEVTSAMTRARTLVEMENRRLRMGDSGEVGVATLADALGGRRSWKHAVKQRRLDKGGIRRCGLIAPAVAK